MTILQTNRHDERGFCIVLNAGSGEGETGTTSDAISGVLTAAGRSHEIFRVDDPAGLPKIAEQAVLKAQQSNGIVVAAGGDGTLNAVAQATLGSGCEFGVIPQGTFNYFGRTHGIPADATEATRALLTARVYPVQVGLVNGRVFLVNASLGLYRQSLEDREEQKQRFGRSRLIAAWAAVGTILRGYRPMLIKLQREDEELELRTLTLFVGNNRLQLEQIGTRHRRRRGWQARRAGAAPRVDVGVAGVARSRSDGPAEQGTRRGQFCIDEANGYALESADTPPQDCD